MGLEASSIDQEGFLVYQAALEHDFEDTADLEHELEITLVHEIAHFMGFDEDQLEELGYG